MTIAVEFDCVARPASKLVSGAAARHAERMLPDKEHRRKLSGVSELANDAPIQLFEFPNGLDPAIPVPEKMATRLSG